jgi:hypothetical protein
MAGTGFGHFGLPFQWDFILTLYIEKRNCSLTGLVLLMRKITQWLKNFIRLFSADFS